MVGGPASCRTTWPRSSRGIQTGGGFTRLFGADRYATAAAISANTFAPGVPTAYVTTGENWPDALAAVPHAARAGGPLLLTRGSALPDSIAAELERLDPGRIIVVGGSAASPMRSGRARRVRHRGWRAAHRWRGSLRHGRRAVGLPPSRRCGPGVRGDRPRTSPTHSARGRRRPCATRRRSSSESTSIPPHSGGELDRLNPTRIILLGGPSVDHEVRLGGARGLRRP